MENISLQNYATFCNTMKILAGLLFSREKVITTWVISYDGNMMIYVIFRKDEWFCPSQNVSSTLCSSECYLALTYYSKIHSKSKQIAATEVESKPRKICTCLPISFSFYNGLIILLTKMIWVTSYDGNMMIYAIFRKDEWFVCFQVLQVHQFQKSLII